MANKDFRQTTWDERTREDCREVIRLAIREDLDRGHDWTTVLLVPDDAAGNARVVARQAGVVAGLPAAAMALEEMDRRVTWTPALADGQTVDAGQTVAVVTGPARTLLTAERTVLNILGRLSGIASLTRRYVEAVAGTQARIFDTRKTTPGWRRLEKYAVRVGGGHNHRTGLFDAVLIKDNHLALGAAGTGAAAFSPAEAVERVRAFLAGLPASDPRAGMVVEVEVDSLDQLDAVLPAGPDLVLLDNMPPAVLREAVQRRDAGFPGIELEASGGVTLETVAEIARTGAERISAGALTHSAVWLDVGMDWDLGVGA
jgi:nicotinate-nucleotide pyrophosphorylase (carboxylating)